MPSVASTALTQLIYVSSAVQPFTDQQLKDLLILARDANRKNEVTGLLLYKSGNFMQVIEGSEDKLDQLYSNILVDPTHSGVIPLMKEPIEHREFSDWSMDFKKLAPEEGEGFSEFLSAGSGNERELGNAKAVLLGFKRSIS